MKIRSMLAALVAAAILILGMPATPVRADGAASTRNLILLGGAAATYLIIQHNRKVHEEQAQAAARQATLQEQNDNAWSAYQQAEHAYQEEVAANNALEKEVAYQHSVVVAQERELSSLSVHNDGGPGGENVVSYGWGNV